MRFNISPMTEHDAQEYVSWRYEAPYDIYNIILDADETRQYLKFCIDPVNKMYSIRDDFGEVVGFCVFGADAQINGGDYGQDDLDVGMGVRPDHTGKGLGAVFAEAVIQFAKAKHSPEALRVTILDYNKRAQKVWERLGFKKTQEFVSGSSKCVVLTLEVQ